MQQKVLDGRYEIEHKIGEGGMARVYAGRDLRLNRRVAIKIPHQHISSDADFLDRFRHEAQAAAILTHPNIVDVYDVGQDGNTHYIVMEFVEGTDLKSIIHREAPLPIPRAVELAEQIARGLSAAHRAGMVHRDVKPQNVIVTADGHARISDFGVAKSHLSTAMTETGVSFGTVDYISPEQAQGRPASAQSDIYSLGVVLYEMLTARLPFTGDSAVAVAMKHVSEPPFSPRKLNPQIPPQLDALVLRALAKDPAQRPRSAQEFAQQLSGYSQISQQETMVNPALGGARQAPPRQVQPQSRGTTGTISTNSTGRINIPPPRTAPARVQRQEGLGCGVFLVGMLILAGVLGVVFLFSTGTFNGLFGSINNPRPTTIVGETAIPTITPTLEPTPDARVPVPVLTGLNDQAAQELLRANQLQPFSETENHLTIPLGQVISQQVPPGAMLSPGQVVTYTVSLGPELVLVPVPDVTFVRSSAAQAQIMAAGLVFEVIEEPSTTVDAGFVISQFPSANLRVNQGETVQIRVSLGDVMRFPEVIGLQREQAEQILLNAGIVVTYVDVQGRDRLIDFDTFSPGEVVSAQIENGKAIVNGEYIPRFSRVILGVRGD